MFFVVAIVTLILLSYLLNKHQHTYWTNRGFFQLNPKFFVGDIGPMLTLKVSFGEYFERLYRNYKQHKALGVYFSYQPAIVVVDPVFLQNVMIRDFAKFHDRPVPFDMENEPLNAHLFNLAGQKWRDLRVKLSPTFTSGKLKGMFPVIKGVGQVLEDYLVNNVKNGVDVFEFRDLLSRFNTSIISSTAFGIDNDCINEPDHIFRKMGAKNFEATWRTDMRNLLALFAPKLIKLIKFKMIEPDVNEFIFSIVKQTVEYREQKNFSRNDFMQLLIQLKNEGYVSVDKGEKDLKETTPEVKKLSLNDLAAQVFVFFIAGSDTSSSTMSFCLYELAKNPKLQREAQEELDRILKSPGKKDITYELLNEMKHLECCIDETLRKYPIVPLLMRQCTEDYKMPDSDSVIPKGTGLMIPVLGYHRDPEIYESPMDFKPDRFLNSSHGGGKGKGLFYIPFGDGPRNCIGMRMGKLTAKLALAIVLSNFSVEFDDKSMADSELEFHPKQFVLTPLKDFNLKIVLRSKKE